MNRFTGLLASFCLALVSAAGAGTSPLVIGVDGTVAIRGSGSIRVPLQGALVEISQAGSVVAQASTDAAGNYQVALPVSAGPGAYTVKATLPFPGGGHPPVVNYRYPNAVQTPVADPGADRIQLGAGANPGIDIVFPQPVVLVHGLFGDAVSTWGEAESLLRLDPAQKSLRFQTGAGQPLAQRAFIAHSLSYGPAAIHSWRGHGANAGFLDAEIRAAQGTWAQHLPAGAPFDILAHSMGGIIARAWLHAHSRQGEVDRVFSFSTPHLGLTYLFGQSQNPSTFVPTALKQLDPLYMVLSFQSQFSALKGARFVLIGGSTDRNPVAPEPTLAPLLQMPPHDDGVVSTYSSVLYPILYLDLNVIGGYLLPDEHSELHSNFPNNTLNDVLLPALESLR